MGYIEQGYLGKSTKKVADGEKPLLKITETIKNWTEQPHTAPKLFKKLQFGNLSNNHLLAAQSDEVFVKLMPFFESVSLSVGESIYQPDDRVDFVYFPESAVISEFQILEDGRTIEIAMTGREGAVGLLAAFNSQRAANWTQTSIAGNALRIKTKILEEIGRAASFQTVFFEFINAYIRQISQRAVCNSLHTVEERFCSWLLMLQDRRKTDELPLTHEQIARFLGVHRPSITHIAKALREKRAIDYLRGKIFIRRREVLEKFACGCYAEIDKNLRENLLINSLKKNVVM